jgi:hypothetical protein
MGYIRERGGGEMGKGGEQKGEKGSGKGDHKKVGGGGGGGVIGSFQGKVYMGTTGDLKVHKHEIIWNFF